MSSTARHNTKIKLLGQFLIHGNEDFTANNARQLVAANYYSLLPKTRIKTFENYFTIGSGSSHMSSIQAANYQYKRIVRIIQFERFPQVLCIAYEHHQNEEKRGSWVECNDSGTRNTWILVSFKQENDLNKVATLFELKNPELNRKEEVAIEVDKARSPSVISLASTRQSTRQPSPVPIYHEPTPEPPSESSSEPTPIPSPEPSEDDEEVMEVVQVTHVESAPRRPPSSSSSSSDDGEDRILIEESEIALNYHKPSGTVSIDPDGPIRLYCARFKRKDQNYDDDKESSDDGRNSHSGVQYKFNGVDYVEPVPKQRTLDRVTVESSADEAERSSSHISGSVQLNSQLGYDVDNSQQLGYDVNNSQQLGYDVEGSTTGGVNYGGYDINVTQENGDNSYIGF